MEYKGLTLRWLGHASFLLEHGEKRVYIDPFQIGRARPDADYILITHDHYDHLSEEDIDNIRGEETVIIAPEGCRPKLQDIPAQLHTLSVGAEKEFPDFTLRLIAAYNTNKKFHPKEEGWVGFLIDFGNVTVYHAGDTDLIEEMQDISADVALLPVSGIYVMNPQEAAQAAKRVGASVAIPMHYGSIVGDPSQAEEFVKLVGKKAVILTKE